jgi:predicted aldo/keto reductase-like oxidoreductase
MPCPAGVDIPGNFAHLNNAVLYDDIEGTRFSFQSFMPPASRAANCTGCGRCEELCPQGIVVRAMLQEVTARLA